VIKGLGKVDGTFPDQPYFRLVDGPNPLNGE
jgi:hypothetical protein